MFMLRLNLYKSSNPINVWENRGGLIHLLNVQVVMVAVSVVCVIAAFVETKCANRSGVGQGAHVSALQLPPILDCLHYMLCL